jgi:nucleoside-diphosphate-sugar epimerase
MQTGLELVVVRPPLVYGWRAPGNFAALVNWISRGLPLPLARAKDNRRSYVGIDNLADFLSLCVSHPQAVGQTFLVSDEEAISTVELVENIAAALGCRPRLWPVPLSWMRLVAQMSGRDDALQRLLGNLEVNTSKARALLGWRPSLNMIEQLNKPPN